MLCLPALAVLAALGVASAAAADEEPVAKPPPYEGAMSFPLILGLGGPEDYSWTVRLGPDQELIQVDERRAAVKYDDGVTAFHIEAAAAHDSEGTTVPTTLAVSEGDVITLTVHHRAGNPAVGGTPFHYPVTSGVGWEGGFHTSMGTWSIETQEPAPKCVTPRLTGNSLALARERLAKRGCTLGAIRGKRKGLKVVKQFRDPGTVLAAGSRVAVKLG